MSADREDDFDRGVKNRRAVLGDTRVDQALDHTTRRVLVLGMTMGMARWEEFELHCKASIRGGVPLAMIKETLMQGAIYCGVPAANTAFELTMKVLREEGLLLAPDALTAGVRVSTHHTFSQPQLNVAVQGPVDCSGVPVVLSHALGADLHLWDGLAAQLAAQGHPVLRYDHRGHGGSAVPAGPYLMDALVDDAARLVREWGRGPVVFVGLSMGGMVGQGLAVCHPELVKGLVLANTSAQYPEAAKAVWAGRIATVEAQGLEAVVDATMERWFCAAYRGAHPDVVAGFRAMVLRNDAAGYMASCHAVANVDWLGRLGELTCPTLIIAGEHDLGAPVAMSQAMAERIAGAELVVLADAAHIRVVEQPAAFARHLDAFLARLPADCGA